MLADRFSVWLPSPLPLPLPSPSPQILTYTCMYVFRRTFDFALFWFRFFKAIRCNIFSFCSDDRCVLASRFRLGAFYLCLNGDVCEYLSVIVAACCCCCCCEKQSSKAEMNGKASQAINRDFEIEWFALEQVQSLLGTCSPWVRLPFKPCQCLFSFSRWLFLASSLYLRAMPTAIASCSTLNAPLISFGLNCLAQLVRSELPPQQVDGSHCYVAQRHNM